MTIASGIGGQWGIGVESPIGTRATPTVFLEFTKESLKLNRPRKTSSAIRANRFTPRRAYQLAQWVDGDVEFELAPQSVGKLIKHTFGSVSTSGAGPYMHTFTHGAVDALGLTFQINRPDSSATDRPFDYTGLQVTKLSLAANVDDIVMATVSVYGQHEDTAQTLASASYPSTWTPFTFLHGVLTLAGTEVSVKSVSVDVDTGLQTGRHFLRTTTPQRPKASISAHTRDIGGTIVADFESLTAYNRFVNQTAAALTLTFTSGTNILAITGNIEFDGETPNITSEDMLEQRLPWKALHATSDTSAFQMVLTNSDSTP